MGGALLGRSGRSLAFARALGFERAWADDDLPDLPFDAVIDASNAAHLPARALALVEPAGRVVYVGLAGSHSLIDTRALALKDVTAVGILSASPGLDATIEAYAGGAVDPRPLIAATVGLEEVGAVLAGERPEGAGPGPRSTSTRGSAERHVPGTIGRGRRFSNRVRASRPAVGCLRLRRPRS